jgi:ankyrin repeat protein
MTKGVLFTDNLDELKIWYETYGKNKDSKTLFKGLMNAIENHRVEIAKFFLEKNIDLNMKDSDGRTPLMVAAFEDLVDIVRILLEKGANILETDVDGDTVLRYMHAFTEDPLTENRFTIMKLMIDHGLDVNSTVFEAPLFVNSCYDNHVEVTKYLYEKGANVHSIDTENGRNALSAAVKKNNLEMITFLLEKGVDVNNVDKDGQSVLFRALDSNEVNMDIVNALLNAGANIHHKTSNDISIFRKACIIRNMDVVKALIAKGIDVNQEYNDDNDILYSANAEILQLFFDSGLEFDIQSDFGNELLAYKACAADIDSVKLLLEKGANVNGHTECGATPLLEACSMVYDEKSVEMIKFLLEHGANPNLCYQNEGKVSPLHKAVQEGSLEAVKLLVEHGADINYKESQNEYDAYYMDTALHAAVKRNELEIVKYLVEQGADVYIPDEYGFTILDSSDTKEMRAYVKTVFIVEPLNFPFPDVTCFDEIAQEEIHVKDFMKNEEQILIRFGQTIKGYNRHDLSDHYHRNEYKLYDNSVLADGSNAKILKTANHFFVAHYKDGECHLTPVEFDEFFG